MKHTNRGVARTCWKDHPRVSAALVLLLALAAPRPASGQWNCAGGSCTTTGNVGVGITRPFEAVL